VTWAEAQREAMRRWGRVGFALVESEGHRRLCTHVQVCKVGTIGALPARVAFGRGLTWEEAFADADKRAAARGDVEVTRVGYAPLGEVRSG